MSSRYDPFAAQTYSNIAQDIGDYARNTPIGQLIGVADDQQERSGQRYGAYDSNVKRGDPTYAGPVYSGGSQVGSGGDITQYQQQGQAVPTMLTGAGYQEIGSGVGRTREVLNPEDVGYIKYTDRDAQYAAYQPQIDALSLSDEEYANATEAERQQNYEARQALATEIRNKTGQSADFTNPYGSINLAAADKESLSGLYSDLETKQESGEISQETFDRYTDDLGRSLLPELSDQRNMLLGAGFTEQELQEAGYDDFADINEDSFRSTVEDVGLLDEKQAVKTYELYDTRQEQNFDNAFSRLDELDAASPDEFSTAYNSLGTEQKNAYLYHQFQNKQLGEEEYQAAVVQNLLNDGVPLFVTDEGEIAKGYKYQTGYQVLNFGDSDAKRDAGDNFSRVSLDAKFNKAGVDEEFISRRHDVEDMEKGNISWGEVGYEKVPEASIGERIKAPVLNWATGGLYSAASNPEQFLIDQFGGALIGGALDKFDVALTDVPPEVQSGVKKTVVKLAQGEDFEDALQSGVVEWASNSGIGGELEKELKQAGRDFDDNYLQPIKDMLPDTPEGIKAIEDAARALGSGIEDAVEPLKEPVETVGRFIDDTLLQPAKDALMGAGGAMLTGMVGGGGGQPSSTRTTDSLFRDELFKFSPVEFTNVERVVQPEQQQIVEEEEEEMQDLFASPFTSPLDRYTV